MRCRFAAWATLNRRAITDRTEPSRFFAPTSDSGDFKSIRFVSKFSSVGCCGIGDLGLSAVFTEPHSSWQSRDLEHPPSPPGMTAVAHSSWPGPPTARRGGKPNRPAFASVATHLALSPGDSAFPHACSTCTCPLQLVTHVPERLLPMSPV